VQRLAIVLMLTIVPMVRADEVRRAWHEAPAPLHVVTPVSTDFETQIRTAWAQLPQPLRSDLARAGWQVQLAEFVIDAAPALAESHPRGWPSGTSWQQTDAIYLPQERRLVVAEKRRTAQGQIVPATRAAGVLRHETGHAFDLAHGGRYKFLSASPGFRAAYEADVARMLPEQRQALAYYLQRSAAGRQETLAEAFAISLGGGSDTANATIFPRHFAM
jgi:hypothetical protein